MKLGLNCRGCDSLKHRVVASQLLAHELILDEAPPPLKHAPNLGLQVVLDCLGRGLNVRWHQQLHVLVGFVLLVQPGKVPVLNEVPAHVLHGFSHHHHRNIVPGHPGDEVPVNQGHVVALNVDEVLNSGVRIVDSRVEQHFLARGWVFHRNIYYRVAVVVHAALAQIEAAHKSHYLIDHNQLFVVRPEQRDEVVGVPLHFDVRVQRFQSPFGVG